MSYQEKVDFCLQFPQYFNEDEIDFLKIMNWLEDVHDYGNRLLVDRYVSRLSLFGLEV